MNEQKPPVIVQLSPLAANQVVDELGLRERERREDRRERLSSILWVVALVFGGLFFLAQLLAVLVAPRREDP